MPSPARAFRFASAPDIAGHSKLRLARTKARRLLGGAAVSDVPVRVGGVVVFAGGESFDTDWSVLAEVFAEQEYRSGGFEGATVLDLGAHKGYFGAYAVAHGAERVISYEPAPENFRFLSRAAETTRNWTARPLAIAGSRGFVELRLASAWAHSILPGRHPDAESVRVEAVTLEDAVADAGEPSGRLVVKIDIEGAEADVLATTPDATWARIDEVMIEVHRWACQPSDVVARLLEVGLEVEPNDDPDDPVLHFLRRP